MAGSTSYTASQNKRKRTSTSTPTQSGLSNSLSSSKKQKQAQVSKRRVLHQSDDDDAVVSIASCPPPRTQAKSTWTSRNSNTQAGPGPSTAAANAAAWSTAAATISKKKRARQVSSDEDYDDPSSDSNGGDLGLSTLMSQKKAPRHADAQPQKQTKGSGRRQSVVKDGPSTSVNGKGKSKKKTSMNKKPRRSSGRVNLGTFEVNSDGEDVGELEIRRKRIRNKAFTVSDEDGNDSPIECSSPVRGSQVRMREGSDGAIIILSSDEGGDEEEDEGLQPAWKRLKRNPPSSKTRPALASRRQTSPIIDEQPTSPIPPLRQPSPPSQCPTPPSHEPTPEDIINPLPDVIDEPPIQLFTPPPTSPAKDTRANKESEGSAKKSRPKPRQKAFCAFEQQTVTCTYSKGDAWARTVPVWTSTWFSRAATKKKCTSDAVNGQCTIATSTRQGTATLSSATASPLGIDAGESDQPVTDAVQDEASAEPVEDAMAEECVPEAEDDSNSKVQPPETDLNATSEAIDCSAGSVSGADAETSSVEDAIAASLLVEEDQDDGMPSEVNLEPEPSTPTLNMEPSPLPSNADDVATARGSNDATPTPHVQPELDSMSLEEEVDAKPIVDRLVAEAMVQPNYGNRLIDLVHKMYEAVTVADKEFMLAKSIAMPATTGTKDREGSTSCSGTAVTSASFGSTDLDDSMSLGDLDLAYPDD